MIHRLMSVGSSSAMHGASLAVVMVGALFMAACGGQQTPPEQPAPAAAPPPSVTPPASPGFEAPAPESPDTAESESTPETETVIDADALMSGRYDGGVDPDGAGVDYEALIRAREQMLEDLEVDAAAAGTGDGQEVLLPEDFPGDVRLPEDLTLQSARSDGAGGLLVQATSEHPVEHLLTHLLQSMHDDGWELRQQMQEGGQWEGMNTLVFVKDERSAQFNIVRSDRIDGQQLTLILSQQ